MTPHERFLALIVDFAGPAPEGVLETVQNEMFLDADGPVRLALDPAREEISISTLIYCARGTSERLDPGLVADFNAHHLFHGGFRLSIDLNCECVTIAQTKSLARIEASGLNAYFADFVECCANCSRWYAGEVEEDDAGDEDASPQSPESLMIV